MEARDVFSPELPQSSQSPENKGRFYKLRDKVKNAFKREENALVKEEIPWSGSMPPLQIDFRFGPHVTAKDAEAQTRDLESYDIIIPEDITWTESSMAFTRRVSAGKVRTREIKKKSKNLLFSDYQKGYLQAINGSHVAVGFMDMSQEQSEQNMNSVSEALKSIVEGDRAIKKGDFTVALEKFNNSNVLISQLTSSRDQYAVEAFPNKIRNILQAYPELRDKPELKVLITLGSDHTYMVNDLRKKGYNASRSYTNKPQYFGPGAQIRFRLGSNKEVSEELLARDLLEFLLKSNYSFMRLRGENAGKVDELETRICSTFSFSEIQAFIEGFKGKTEMEQRESLDGFLGKKGIQVPKTEGELDVVLQSLRERRETSTIS